MVSGTGVSANGGDTKGSGDVYVVSFTGLVCVENAAIRKATMNKIHSVLISQIF